MEVEGGLFLAEALKHLPNIRVLLFFQNGIRKHAMEYVLDSINIYLKKLEVLDISDNFAYGEAVTKLAEILRNPEFKIRALNLSDCVEKDDLGTIIDALKVS
jgi:Ran GTPase-activating protein (RanGAP) involved in mRNA processing and transport